MKKLYIWLLMGLPVLLFFSCKKEGRIDHLDPDAPPPARISGVKVSPTPGGAILTYKIPEDPNLSYVKAVYDIRSGVTREVKSSYYTDTLRLVGFGDTSTYQVKLYSVGRNEKESDPVSVSVTPLIPPVYSVYDSLSVIPAFGGVQVNFKNASQAKLAIKLITDTTGNGDWKELTTFHTGALKGSFSVRGLDTTKQKFGVFVRDRWNNKSDTLIKQLSPIFEELIPKNTWETLPLPTDQVKLASSTKHFQMSNMWDGYWDWTNGHAPYASSNGASLPQWFTIDLGEKVSISRIVEHQAPHSHLYEGSGVKTFELWGSNHPDTDGSWASWDSLGTFHSFKPSGLPVGQLSAQDKQYGNVEGEDFDFDDVLPAYRYIRWKTLETWGGGGQVVISEITLYGQVHP